MCWPIRGQYSPAQGVQQPLLPAPQPPEVNTRPVARVKSLELPQPEIWRLCHQTIYSFHSVINTSNTERHKKSSVPFLQKLLNEDYSKQKKNLSKLLHVNNGVLYNTPSLFENIYYYYCQALVPSPVPLDPIPNKSQIQKSNWDWGDPKITRLR